MRVMFLCVAFLLIHTCIDIQISNVSSHSSQVMHHTSHVPRHSSHTTYHTSHIKHRKMIPATGENCIIDGRFVNQLIFSLLVTGLRINRRSQYADVTLSDVCPTRFAASLSGTLRLALKARALLRPHQVSSWCCCLLFTHFSGGVASCANLSITGHVNASRISAAIGGAVLSANNLSISEPAVISKTPAINQLINHV